MKHFMDEILDGFMINTLHKTQRYHLKTLGDGSYQFEMPLPGCTKDDISVKIIKSKLVLIIKSTDNLWVNSGKAEFYIPSEIISKDVTAKLEDGVLSVSLPVSKEYNVDVKLS